MMPFFFDPTIIILIPALLFAGWAQMKVKSTYNKYSQIASRSGMTGADVARAILRDAGVEFARDAATAVRGAVGVEAVQGNLTDHYDPRSKTLRLSEGVYNGRSVAALGIAAHEVGHAIQDARGYAPLVLRSTMYPLANIGTNLAWPLFFGGLILTFLGVAGMVWLLYVGVILFTLAVAFTVVTLPVEFNASKRAVAALAHGGYLQEDELQGTKKVLNAAALTYVAAALMAVLQLVRMLVILGAVRR